MSERMSEWIYACMYVCMYACVYGCMNRISEWHVCMHACMYVCTTCGYDAKYIRHSPYVCMYVYMQTYLPPFPKYIEYFSFQ